MFAFPIVNFCKFCHKLNQLYLFKIRVINKNWGFSFKIVVIAYYFSFSPEKNSWNEQKGLDTYSKCYLSMLAKLTDYIYTFMYINLFICMVVCKYMKHLSHAIERTYLASIPSIQAGNEPARQTDKYTR